MLDKPDFVELAYHILKGDQLIVRGSDISTVTSIINVLKVQYVWKLCIELYKETLGAFM